MLEIKTLISQTSIHKSVPVVECCIMLQVLKFNFVNQCLAPPTGQKRAHKKIKKNFAKVLMSNG